MPEGLRTANQETRKENSTRSNGLSRKNRGRAARRCSPHPQKARERPALHGVRESAESPSATAVAKSAGATGAARGWRKRRTASAVHEQVAKRKAPLAGVFASGAAVRF